MPRDHDVELRPPPERRRKTQQMRDDYDQPASSRHAPISVRTAFGRDAGLADVFYPGEPGYEERSG